MQTPGRRVALLVVVAAMVAVVLSWSTSSPDSPAPPPAAAPVTEAPDAASASMAAHLQGTKVEVLSERTDTRTVYADPDGGHTARISAVPTRFQRDGEWVDIDRTLTHRPDGSVAPAAVGDDVTLSGGGDAPLLRLRSGPHELSLHWPTALPEPKLSGDSARYPEVLPGVDLVMRAQSHGYQQLLEIRTAKAAANPALARIGLRVTTKELRLTADPSGALRALDGAGNAVFVSAPSVMWDASESRTAAVRVEVAGDTLTLVPDQGFLTDPATEYPVTVDPTVSPVYKAQWATTVSGYPGATYWWKSADDKHPDWAQVGQCWNGNRDCGGIGEAWAFFQFDTGFLHDKNVEWAKFYTRVAHSPTCGTHAHWLRQFHHGIASTINWHNKPVGPDVTEFGAPPRVGCGDSTGHVGLVLPHALHRFGWTGFSLQAKDGGHQDSWRKYYSADTFLEVRWNRPPHAPSGLRTDPALPAPCRWCGGLPYVADAGIRLIATLSDPDGDALRPLWRARPQLMGEMVHEPNDFKPSGVGHSWTPGLGHADNRRIDWWVHGGDAATAGGETHGQPFMTDFKGITVKPAVASAAYPSDNAWHGGVGVPGSFTFSPGAVCQQPRDTPGVCDIDHYRYSWTSPPPATSKVDADALGGSATVTTAPPGDGPRTLYVQSVDRGGHASPIQEHRVYVRAGNGPYALWSMEGNANDTAFLGNRHGTTTGNVSYAPGAVSSAMVLDGADTTMMTAPNAVRTDSSLSVSAWVRLDRAEGGGTVVEQVGQHQDGFSLMYHAERRTWVFVLPGSDVAGMNEWYFAESPQQAAVNTWTHLAGTYDGVTRQITLYVNGEPVNTATRQTSWHASGRVQVGRTWKGALDEVAVHDRVLSAADVRAAVSQGNVQTGHWRFDDEDGTTAKNSAEGGDDGVLHNGAAFTDDGAVNRGLRLDGQDDYVATSGPVVRTDQSFTVAAWVKADRLVDYGSMTAVSQDGNRNSGFFLQYNRTVDKWVFLRYRQDSDDFPDGSWVGLTASQAPSTEWTHLAGTFNAADRKMKIYVNGQFGGETTLPVAPWDARGPLTVGRAKLAGRIVDHWPGLVDEVRTYSRVLSAAELEGIVSRSDVPAANWSLDGNATDSSSNGRDGTLFGGPTWTAGQSTMVDPADMAVNLDGADDYVRAPLAVNTTQSYSVSAWVRLGQRKPGWQAVVSQQGTSTAAFTLGYSGTDGSGGLTNRWAFQINGPDRNNPPSLRVNSDQPVQTGVWTHLAAVYRAGSNEAWLYVNGVESGFARLGTQTVFGATGGFEIGRSLWNGVHGNYFGGAVDDVRMHSRPLFAEEIRVMAGRDPAHVHHWRLDEGSGATAADAVGQRPATLTGGAAYGPGRSGNAIRFDGNDDVASTTGVDLRTDRGFTVSAWVNLDKPGPCAGTCHATAVSVDGGTASNTSKFRLGHRIDTDQAPDGKWVFEMPERDGWVTEAAISVEPSQFGTWVQLVGVYDPAAGQIWLYVLGTGGEDVDDGTLMTPWHADGGALRIGRSQRGGQPADHWRGSVDDVRLYADGLDADRITALHRSYAASAAAPELPKADAQWKFDEAAGTTAADSGDRAQNLTLRGGADWFSGREGTMVRLNGTTGYADTAGPVLNTGQSFTVSAWTYTTRSSGNHQTVVAQDGTTNSAMLVQYQPSTGRWTFEVPIPGAPSLVVHSTEPALFGTWTNVAVTYDAALGQARLYLNGLVSAVQVGVSIPESSGQFTIGRGKRNGNSVDFFSGGVDDVRTFGRALTDGEIRRLHDDSPFADHGTWAFEGTMTDASWRAMPTTLTGTTGFEPGVRGQALRLDGRTGAATTNVAGVNMFDSFTVSAWVRLGSTDADATVLGQDGARMSGFLLQYNKNVGRWVFGAAKQDADHEQLVHVHSPQAPAVNTWTHLTGTYDYAARQLRLYVNGELVGVRDNTPLWPATGVHTIGRGRYNGEPAGYFNGLLDEVRIDLGVVPDAEVASRAGHAAPAGGQLGRFTDAAGERGTANSAGSHVEPFTPVPAGTRFDRPLGRLLGAEQPETRMLYACRSGADEFTSTDPACGGATKAADLGWAYTTPPAAIPTVPLYRCVTGTDRFDSLDANCEGGTQQEVLGHVLAYAALTHYVHSQDWERTTTTLGMAPGYKRVETQGLLLLVEQPGTQRLWLCRKGIDQFATTDAACAGETPVTALGWVWTEPLPGAASRQLYLCQSARGRFNHTDPACGAGLAAGAPVGHLMNIEPMTRQESVR